MVKFIKGSKIYLRGLTKEDCQGNYLDMVNDVDNLSFVSTIGYRPIYPNELEAYVEASKNDCNLLLGIFENGTDIHVGNVHLGLIEPYHNSCRFGILMHRDYLGKGYAYEASSLLIKHAFMVMNMHRIHISVIGKNFQAIKLYEKLGAVKEGVSREAFYINNKYHDAIVYSILRDEYLKNL